MNIRQLKIFISVSENESMTAAAGEMHMSQPAISQTIADLEKELGQRLFERIKHNLLLTYSGEKLLQYAKKIIVLLDEAEATMNDINKLREGRIRIGASMTIGTYVLPEILKQFNNDFSNIDTSLLIDNTRVIAEKVLSNQIDLGFIEGPVESEDLDLKLYYHDHLSLICSPTHPWSTRGKIRVDELRGQDFIMREEGSGTRRVIEGVLGRYNINYQVKHVLNNIEAIKKAVTANLGISILPEISIREAVSRRELKMISISGVELLRDFNIIFHKDKYHSKILDKFVGYL